MIPNTVCWQSLQGSVIFVIPICLDKRAPYGARFKRFHDRPTRDVVALINHEARRQESNLAMPPADITQSNLEALGLPKMYTSKVACIYDVTGKCGGTLAPEDFHTSTKHMMTPNMVEFMIPSISPLKSFASELSGLFLHLALHDNKKPMNTKAEFSYMHALPLRFYFAFQTWA